MKRNYGVIGEHVVFLPVVAALFGRSLFQVARFNQVYGLAQTLQFCRMGPSVPQLEQFTALLNASWVRLGIAPTFTAFAESQLIHNLSTLRPQNVEQGRVVTAARSTGVQTLRYYKPRPLPLYTMTKIQRHLEDIHLARRSRGRDKPRRISNSEPRRQWVPLATGGQLP